MDNPFKGWKILTSCLNNDSLMLIGLYSEKARQHIKEIKNKINKLKLQSNYNNIIKFRKDLIENFNLQLELDDTYVQKLVAKGKVGHGGRGLINIIEQQIVNPMSLFIFSRLHQIGDKKLTLFIDADEDGNSRFSFLE